MSVFLAVTPAEAASCRGYRVPLVHIAYAVGDGGRLLRSELPRGAQGGLLGLSDRCNGPLPELPMLCRAILGDRMNQALNAMRRTGLRIPSKAMLTAANRGWRPAELFAELQKEHTAMTAKR